ncbi:ABC transporter ATP-binding protein [Rivibacter subsaxonicus]|uniref:Iron(III) transport system ATP-binding protein n=1 Tax=Rivibacter subsaxonicus TaxID=457575 RepID=A0A4Q7VGW4_9BURK|nr:ABC transporter ATP-binding protein [Rivibacter subsaxonicus]RZT95291.1 iron(III) transport system ATP-binding protein [Rivibacter subsaxonicus]
MFLEIDQATVCYPAAHAAERTAAVEAVSFGLAAGEIGVLIGPSGCGKTTLLRAVAGLEPLHSGRISLAGQLLSEGGGAHVSPERRRVGMVFQDYALFPHLSVAQNVGFGLAGESRSARAARVAELLDLVGLGHTATRAPHQLSGGQQQRVALARALAARPALLLLDEPFSSLDVDLRERLAQELRAILKRTGTTALFVTHDQLEAFALGDRIGVMHRGRLEQWDEPYALYHRPATRFVADFIGHGVFAPAELVQGPAGLRVRTPLGDFADRSGTPAAPASGGAGLEVLLRADDIVHDDASPLKACIERKAFRGSEFLYTLRLASGEQLLAHVPSHHDHQIGEWIGIRAEIEHVVTFARAG